jgi:RimJ/RimL family protein N-acetyltransferase
MKALFTSRFRLEPLRLEHAAPMFELLSDAQIYEFLTSAPPVSLAALAERYLRLETRGPADGSEQWLNWIIQPLAGDACLGFIQATLYTPQTADFGFILGPAYWGDGIAFEASVAVLHALWADYSLTSIFATVDARNERSLSLLNRLGFRRIDRSAYPHGEVLPTDDVFQRDAAAPSG